MAFFRQIAFKPFKNSLRFYTNSKLQNVKAATTTKGTSVLSVKWDDGKEETYPAVWLRDNCQCHECYVDTALSRKLQMKHLDVNVTLKDQTLKLDHDSNEVIVKWPDGHESRFRARFLAKYGRNGTSGDHQGYFDRIQPKLWASDFQILRHQYNDIVHCDKALFNWLHDLSVYGLTLLEGVPQTMMELPNLIRKIAFAETNHYGQFFKVESKPQSNNLAYTVSAIGLHQDLPFYEKTPSTQFLHCVSQTNCEGGGNLFADSFSAAEKIRRDHKHEWEILTNAEIPFSDVGFDEDGGTSFYKVHSRPTIELDENGSVIHTSFNNQVRSRALYWEDDEAMEIYKAINLFSDIMHSPEFIISYKMKAGDCIAFDNVRVFHGRDKFDLQEVGSRLLHGAYVAWDEIRSRMNVIKFMKNEMQH